MNPTTHLKRTTYITKVFQILLSIREKNPLILLEEFFIGWWESDGKWFENLNLSKNNIL